MSKSKCQRNVKIQRVADCRNTPMKEMWFHLRFELWISFEI